MYVFYFAFDYTEADTPLYNYISESFLLPEIRTSIKHNGKRVIIEGFVYRDSSFKKDEFVTVRFLMVCCSADSSIVGLMGKWNKSQTLKSGCSLVFIMALLLSYKYVDVRLLIDLL